MINNIEEFESLCWIETSIENIKYEHDCINFVMKDLISYIPKITIHKTIYEYVEIEIQNIKTLSISLRPFTNGKYEEEECFKVGNLSYSNSVVFEGILINNPFTTKKANYFWITADFEGDNIAINRTGKKI